MKKLMFILIVGCLFAQSNESSINDNLYLLSGESYVGKYISSDSEFVIFKPTGYPTGQSIKKSIISKVVLADGTIIFNSSNKLINKNILGIGVKIDEYPTVTIPINWKSLLFEPRLGFSWESENDSTSTNQFDLNFSVYYNFPTNNKFNILTGVRTGLSINNIYYDFNDGTNLKVSSHKLLHSINLGFQYKIFEDFFLSYETTYQIENNNGGYIEYKHKDKEEFEPNDVTLKKIISSFVIRYYIK